MPKMKTLVIERARWLRGEGSGPSKLLRKEDGKMCCLGFMFLSCGFTPEQIEGHTNPYEMTRYSEVPSWLLMDSGSDSTLAVKLMTINDDLSLPETAREERIKKLFAEGGIKAVFK